MKIIEQSFQVLAITPSPIALIEQAGRVCYKSEDKITPDSASPFVSKLCQTLKHESVIEHASATVLFTTDRGVTHEFVRHRLASYSQESTRYCNYTNEGKFGGEITVIRPVAFDLGTNAYNDWRIGCEDCESAYFSLIRNGIHPQWARSVLPVSLKSDIVVTANFRTWKHILFTRTSPTTHPQFSALLFPLLSLWKKSYPEIFSDISQPQ